MVPLTRMSTLWKILRGVLLVCWSLVSLISINRLYPVTSQFSTLPIGFLGVLGWSTALLAITVCGKGYLRQLSAIALGFFILGAVLGPFLEPPADPLEHLKRVHDNCGKTLDQLSPQNQGLWQYSMIGLLLCTEDGQVSPEKMLRKIDIANGLFWALLSAALFILAVRSGLSAKWAFLSLLICFLFFGTNRFSYFRYYSFAPSSTSLMIYWLWVALFFFKKSCRDIWTGLIVAVLSVPIILVNHIQEAVFLVFIVFIWLVINIAFSSEKRVFVSITDPRSALRIERRFVRVNEAGVILFLASCWVLPQFDFFLQWLSQFFIRDMGQHYQALRVSLHGFYVGGRIGPRVTDTLGLMGVLILLLSVPYFWPSFIKGKFSRKTRIFTLAVVPFLGYFIPVFHFIWSSNVKSAEYYRLCYASIFWIFFADFLSNLEQRVWIVGINLKKIYTRCRRHLKNGKMQL